MSLARQAGGLLADLRGALTRSAAARALGVSRNTLIRLESGADNPTLARLDRLGAAYGVTFELVATDPADGAVTTISPVLAPPADQPDAS